MTTHASDKKPARVPTRVAPHPVGSGISHRSLPPASIDAIVEICDHHVARSAGRYAGPVSRHLFDMANEVKGLLGPLKLEDTRRRARVFHLEQMLRSWSEVFGDGGSPGEMAQRMQEQDEEIDSLKQQLLDEREATRRMEGDCRQTLAQHLRAHQDELLRLEARHASELRQLQESFQASMSAHSGFV
tara:strand:- start:1220 stop:1780 length:561 start_codon:yes stop_codon:yes gene_type:complete